MQKPLLVPLTLMLLVATAFALLFAAQLRVGPTGVQAATSSIATVRAYYAALDTFLDTGDLSGIEAVVDPAMLDVSEAGEHTGDLERYLIALRQTHPLLTVDVVDLHYADGDVTAEVLIDMGVAIAPSGIEPSERNHRERVIEVFRVAGERITNRWSSGSGFGLFANAPDAAIDVRLHRNTALVIARVEYAASSRQFLAIPGPSLVLVEQGNVRMNGDGISALVRAGSPDATKAEPGADVRIAQGDALIVRSWQAVLGNPAHQRAVLLVALFVSTDSELVDHDQATGANLLRRALDEPLGTRLGRDIFVRPVGRATEVFRPGTVQIQSGWAVLTPGGSMDVHDGVGESLLVPRSGGTALEMDHLGNSSRIWNPGTGQEVVWVVQVNAADPDAFACRPTCLADPSSQPQPTMVPQRPPP